MARRRQERGWFVLGTWGKVPVRVHWSALLVAVLLGWMGGGILAAPLFLVLVLVHELGHAWMIRRAGLRLTRIDAHGIGGTAGWSGRPTEWQAITVAWGGVLAQGLVLGLSLAASQADLLPTSGVLAGISHVFIRFNFFMILLNLIPVAPFDGEVAWQVVPLARRNLRKAMRLARHERDRKDKVADRIAADRAAEGVREPVAVPGSPMPRAIDEVDPERLAQVDRMLESLLAIPPEDPDGR